MQWYLDVLKKYAVFDGRARRKEYWMFVLFNVLISIGLSIVDGVTGLGKYGGLGLLYSLGVLVPGIAVGVRRLHDTGRSGLLLLVGFIPCIGFILLLIWFVAEGTAGANEYGPDPKAGER